MTYSTRVERHSISPEGEELLTFVITFPRCVLAEVVTHRANSDSWGDYEFSVCERTTTKEISKNSASSRAIPLSKMIEKIKNDPYMPQWTLNQKGMQGVFANDTEVIKKADEEWIAARDNMIETAIYLNHIGIHKQDCNRLLEPWAWVTQVVTATGTALNNFFALRCHKAAHPAFQKIARMMFLAKRKSVPVKLEYGQWHLPFVPVSQQIEFDWDAIENFDKEPLPDLIKFSAARCAWVSYENAERDSTNDKMIATFDKLTAEIPVHASPCEHQATPHSQPYQYNTLGGNFGQYWIQARKLLPNEKNHQL